MAKKKYGVRYHAVKNGFRSGLEETVSAQLTEKNVEFEYESKANTVKYVVPASNHTYLPDFKLPNGIIVETKGRLMLADKKKHILIKEQHPELDIRFVFSNSNAKMSKASKTTYAMWADKHGFQWADKMIPQSWIDEVK
jgi:hypothetical protein